MYQRSFPGVLALMPPKHSWERVEHGCYQDAAGDILEDGSSDGEDALPLTPEQEFIEFMLGLLMARTLNAKQFCIAMYWAGQAGLTGAKRFGFRPDDKSTGHYTRKLDPILGFKHYNKTLYDVNIPGHSKADLSRTMHTLPVPPPPPRAVDPGHGQRGWFSHLVGGTDPQRLITAMLLRPSCRTRPPRRSSSTFGGLSRLRAVFDHRQCSWGLDDQHLDQRSLLVRCLQEAQSVQMRMQRLVFAVRVVFGLHLVAACTGEPHVADESTRQFAMVGR